MPTREELRDALLAKLREAQAAGRQADGSGPQIREKVVIHKFDHTPLPGEVLEPLETVIVEDGQVQVLPGKGD